ncbi:hypothetical protein HMPREF0380_00070 [Eubacterium infirmum F0142]|nr:hypothetical protein HMPREF0380_00070 [Eubacterium infirmum F0142]
MKKDYLYLALFIMGCQFTVISLICTFIFEKLNFIAYGESYANCVEYLFKFPLVIVIIVGLLMIFTGTAGLYYASKNK